MSMSRMGDGEHMGTWQQTIGSALVTFGLRVHWAYNCIGDSRPHANAV